MYSGKKNLESADWSLILISAILFGLAHIGWLEVFEQVPGWEIPLTTWKILQATVLGVILGYSARQYGILSSMALHWTINSISLTSGILAVIFPTSASTSFLILFLLFLLLLVGIGLANFVKLIEEKWFNEGKSHFAVQRRG